MIRLPFSVWRCRAKVKSISCNHCTKTFGTPSSLRAHLLDKHHFAPAAASKACNKAAKPHGTGHSPQPKAADPPETPDGVGMGTATWSPATHQRKPPPTAARAAGTFHRDPSCPGEKRTSTRRAKKTSATGSAAPQNRKMPRHAAVLAAPPHRLDVRQSSAASPVVRHEYAHDIAEPLSARPLPAAMPKLKAQGKLRTTIRHRTADSPIQAARLSRSEKRPPKAASGKSLSVLEASMGSGTAASFRVPVAARQSAAEERVCREAIARLRVGESDPANATAFPHTAGIPGHAHAQRKDRPVRPRGSPHAPREELASDRCAANELAQGLNSGRIQETVHARIRTQQRVGTVPRMAGPSHNITVRRTWTRGSSVYCEADVGRRRGVYVSDGHGGRPKCVTVLGTAVPPRVCIDDTYDFRPRGKLRRSDKTHDWENGFE